MTENKAVTNALRVEIGRLARMTFWNRPRRAQKLMAKIRNDTSTTAARLAASELLDEIFDFRSPYAPEAELAAIDDAIQNLEHHSFDELIGFSQRISNGNLTLRLLQSLEESNHDDEY